MPLRRACLFASAPRRPTLFGMQHLLIVLMISWLTSLTGLAAVDSTTPEPGTPLNAMCPVLPGEPVVATFTTTYRGQTVWLCCRACIRRFDSDPERYLTGLPQFADGTTTADTAAADSAQPAPATAKRGLLASLGVFHVLVIHFPIALLVLAAALETWRLVVGGTAAPALPVLVHIGAAGAVAAAVLGWCIDTSGVPAASQGLLFWHQWLGTTTAVLAAAASWTFWHARRGCGSGWHIAATLLIIVLGPLVSVVGHFGGSLVYGPNHLWG